MAVFAKSPLPGERGARDPLTVGEQPWIPGASRALVSGKRGDRPVPEGVRMANRHARRKYATSGAPAATGGQGTAPPPEHHERTAWMAVAGEGHA